MCSDSGIKFWMYKEYINKAAAGQTGRWQYLVYESDKLDPSITSMKGVWFYIGFETNHEYSGIW